MLIGHYHKTKKGSKNRLVKGIRIIMKNKKTKSVMKNSKIFLKKKKTKKPQYHCE